MRFGVNRGQGLQSAGCAPGSAPATAPLAGELVAEAQDNGELTFSGDPAQLGRFIVNAWAGALMRSRVVRSGQPIDDFFDLVFISLLA